MEIEKKTEQIRGFLADAEMILIGVGSELEKNGENDDAVDEVYQRIASFVKGKNFFVITGNRDGKISDGTIFHRLTAAFGVEGQEKQVQGYFNWLTGSIGHKTVLLELGEGFKNPQIMRWPFEKTVMINQKAVLIRVGKMFPQVPAELEGRAVSLKMNAEDFVRGYL